MNPVELTITDLAFGGKGVGRHDGKAVFVPDVIPGEKIRARPVRERDRFIEAELVEILQLSPDRVVPPCPAFGICGGCAYQHIAYPAQLRAKALQVEQTLHRIAKLPAVPMRDPVPSPAPYGNRNRIRVHVRDGTIGFFHRDGRSMVDIERCALASDAVNTRLAVFRSRPRYDGEATLGERDRRFFEQTNDAVAALLRDAVAAAVPPETEALVDAYCGAGFFAKALRERIPSITGIESHPAAVEEARRDALPHETYHVGDVADLLGETLVALPSAHVALIADPPASGLDPRVVSTLINHPVATLLYVSCNPATLARDIARLSPAYVLRAVTPFDMFPQTAEIEVLAELCYRPG